MLASQRAFERERLALTPKDEDLRSRLTKLRGGDRGVPPVQPHKKHRSASALKREYLRSQERARKYREDKAKAAVESGAAIAGLTLAAQPSSGEIKIAEAARDEQHRLRFEVNALQALVLSVGLKLPEGVRGKKHITKRIRVVLNNLVSLGQNRGAGCRVTTRVRSVSPRGMALWCRLPPAFGEGNSPPTNPPFPYTF